MATQFLAARMATQFLAARMATKFLAARMATQFLAARMATKFLAGAEQHFAEIMEISPRSLLSFLYDSTSPCYRDLSSCMCALLGCFTYYGRHLVGRSNLVNCSGRLSLGVCSQGALS